MRFVTTPRESCTLIVSNCEQAKKMLDMTKQRALLAKHLAVIDAAVETKEITESGEITLEGLSLPTAASGRQVCVQV